MAYGRLFHQSEEEAENMWAGRNREVNVFNMFEREEIVTMWSFVLCGAHSENPINVQILI